MCVECNSSPPAKFTGKQSGFSIPISLYQQEYKNASEEVENPHFNRHRFNHFGSMSLIQLQKHIENYLIKMAKHYLYVEMGECDSSEFKKWGIPYLDKKLSLKQNLRLV